MVADIQDKSFKMIMSSDIIIYNVLWIGMTNPHKQELRVGSTMVASREACKSLESLAEVGGRGCLYLLLTRTRNQDLNFCFCFCILKTQTIIKCSIIFDGKLRNMAYLEGKPKAQKNLNQDLVNVFNFVFKAHKVYSTLSNFSHMSPYILYWSVELTHISYYRGFGPVE